LNWGARGETLFQTIVLYEGDSVFGFCTFLRILTSSTFFGVVKGGDKFAFGIAAEFLAYLILGSICFFFGTAGIAIGLCSTSVGLVSGTCLSYSLGTLASSSS
jgi:hypothetical protein